MRVIVALAALLTAAPTQALGPYEHDEAAIVRVYCQLPIGGSTGTAFKVGPTSYLTAAHVVDEGVCTIDGQPIEVTSMDKGFIGGRRDYATFIGPASPAVLAVNCGGFRAGRTYIARGFPGGGFYKTLEPWHAIRKSINGFQVFLGLAIPGMSGGPVMDESGAVVGLVNMHSPARAVPLKLTGYCNG